ncbi:MAG: cytochrome c biosis protein CcmG, thiol:disulfide interchange protein DsbE [Gaiellaceae bacterium]|nr:cytochrome c biosis protein CcmG, thiol:disulfide interchange protein DsbE [Gaiellaceae bacterium]
MSFRRLSALLALTGALLAVPVSAASLPKLAGPDVRTGKFVALSHYVGKPVFVNFWGSWCEGCRTEARTLAAFERSHRAQLAFIGVDTMDSRAGAKAFYARYDADYPSIWDPRGLIAGSWTLGTPTTLVFDRKHRYVMRLEGPASKAQLTAALRRAIRP